MGKSYTKLLRHQVKKLARQIEKKQREEAKGSDGSSSSSDGDEEEEEVELREPKWSDKGATISDKNAVKEFPGKQRARPYTWLSQSRAVGQGQ